MHIPSFNSRSMPIEWMLQQRHETYLEWCEPLAGMQKNGDQIDCHMTIKASVHHCIYLYRAAHPDVQNNLTDSQCIEDFISIHWATPTG